MIAIGRLFLFGISLAGLTLSVEGRINDVDVFNFLNKIFNLHNKYRQKHGVAKLIRTPEMNSVANHVIDNIFMEQSNQNFSAYGMNIIYMDYNENTELNTDEAKRLFSKWYEKGIDYNYFYELLNNDSHNIFTRMLWNNTELFGIAFRMTNNQYVVQVVYFPHGNIPGIYGMNVFQRPIIAHINNAPLNQLIFENDKRIFKDYIVDLHNIVRNNHNTNLLQRNEQLDIFADDILQSISNDVYEYQGNYGNNYSLKYYDDYTILNKAEAETIFFNWYSKGENYDYESEPLNNDADEFTQILWNNTNAIGISMLREERFYRILVLYDPPGNIEEQFKSNVIRPRDSESGESSSANNSP